MKSEGNEIFISLLGVTHAFSTQSATVGATARAPHSARWRPAGPTHPAPWRAWYGPGSCPRRGGTGPGQARARPGAPGATLQCVGACLRVGHWWQAWALVGQALGDCGVLQAGGQSAAGLRGASGSGARCAPDTPAHVLGPPHAPAGLSPVWPGVVRGACLQAGPHTSANGRLRTYSAVRGQVYAVVRDQCPQHVCRVRQHVVACPCLVCTQASASVL